MIELRGSGTAAAIVGAAAVHAKINTPQSRLNSSDSKSGFARPGLFADEDGAPAAAPKSAPEPVAAAPMAERSTQDWLRQMQLENRISSTSQTGPQGVTVATPASIYQQHTTPALITDTADGGFSELG